MSNAVVLMRVEKRGNDRMGSMTRRCCTLLDQGFLLPVLNGGRSLISCGVRASDGRTAACIPSAVQRTGAHALGGCFSFELGSHGIIRYKSDPMVVIRCFLYPAVHVAQWVYLSLDDENEPCSGHEKPSKAHTTESLLLRTDCQSSSP